MRRILISVLTLLLPAGLSAHEYLLEAESFADKGGWVVDQQFMDIMGSPYLLAHGAGMPVADAATSIVLPGKGTYHVYVRTYNWTSPWHDGEGPGRFGLEVNGHRLPAKLGAVGKNWMWQYAGTTVVKSPRIKVSLHDLTGFDGRCDAVYFSTKRNDNLPQDKAGMEALRRKLLSGYGEPRDEGTFDFVIVGGGIAGMCAAVSAARLGLKVALVHNRPVLGGNNSSEVRVHLGGAIELPPYPNLGNLIKEFGHTKKGNAMPAENYADDRKMAFVTGEENISLYTSCRGVGVEMAQDRIAALLVRNVETGRLMRFRAPLFADCTGDANIGYMAGADFHVGREARSEYGEPSAPTKADKQVMGASVQWYAQDQGMPVTFPEFVYGKVFSDESVERVTKGEWTWETGMLQDQVWDAERVRDHGLLVVYSNWSYLKNRASDNEAFRDLALEWVAYVAGKRESRRLIGDMVLTQNDILQQAAYDDASATTSWTIDLHYPDPENTKFFPGNEFKAVCNQEEIELYPIPYRCFYSRNVPNLFMAGRNISVTHVALGTVRVMRTTAMMGEVVGMAASVCHRHNALPRAVYTTYLSELKSLMEKGCGQQGLPNNQQFNVGRRKHH